MVRREEEEEEEQEMKLRYLKSKGSDGLELFVAADQVGYLLGVCLLSLCCHCCCLLCSFCRHCGVIIVDFYLFIYLFCFTCTLKIFFSEFRLIKNCVSNLLKISFDFFLTSCLCERMQTCVCVCASLEGVVYSQMASLLVLVHTHKSSWQDWFRPECDAVTSPASVGRAAVRPIEVLHSDPVLTSGSHLTLHVFC